MQNTYREIQDFICKLNVDVTIEVFVYNPYWDDYYYDWDEREGADEFADFNFYPYNPFDEPPEQVILTFYEQLKEMVIFNENFDITKYVIPEANIYSYIITWNKTSMVIAKDKVIPFLKQEFPNHITNHSRKEKIDEILNGPDEPLK